VLQQSPAASGYCGKIKELAHAADGPNTDPSKTGEMQAVTTAKVYETEKCAFSVLLHVLALALGFF